MHLKNICFYLSCALLLVGCATSPATQFYTLNATKIEQTTQTFATAKPKCRIAVGQATIPDAVNRAAIMTRHGNNQVQIHENHRWTESLKTEISRVVALNIAASLPDVQVFAYPQQLALGDADFDVMLDVQAFDAIQGERIVLDVQWRVQHRADEKQRITRRSYLTESVDGDDMVAIVAAFSRALAMVSEEIAVAVSSNVIQKPDS